MEARLFRQVLVANRGEIALRIIRACHALKIKAVAVYSEADRDSPHLAEADRAICIGPARSRDSYLNIEAILQAAEQTGCQAVHPGYGFLAQNARFAEMCARQKVTFIGPSARSIRLMGDKIEAKRTFREAGLDPIPGSDGLVSSASEAAEIARRIGYPVLLKATAGGGGKGMRLCRTPEELAAGFPAAVLEAEKAFGNGALYLERFLDGGRHIEFQVLADAYGAVVHLGERECSVQRSHQKLLEESPSPAVDAKLRAEMGARVTVALGRIGYLGAGTVEFLLDERGRLYVMEMNTRLQVEHPVSEMVTGIDIVQEMIRVAANRPLSVRQEEIALRGHAMECRINAEDPDAEFRPCPGTVARFEPPPLSDGQMRLDSHVKAGYVIPPFYDSMIGKLIARGDDRAQAIARMEEALGKFVIEGVKTTIPLHRRILADGGFRAGRYDTRLLSGIGPASEAIPAVRRGLRASRLRGVRGVQPPG